MRKTATLVAVLSISVSVLALTSCDTSNPKPAPDMRETLNKLSGPEVGGVDKSLTSQAEQAAGMGDFKRASQMYQQLADEHPGKKEYVIPLADSLRRVGDGTAALKVIDPYLAKEPEDADALEVKGLAQMSTGDMPEASKTFDKVMKVDGKRWRTLNAIGIMFAARNMQPQAVAYYNAALDASPNNPGVLNNLGLSFAMQKDYDKAMDAFLRARGRVENNPAELRHIDLDLALVYALAGRLDDAEATASPHLVKAELYNNMAFYAYISKNNELAKTYLNMALTQDPAYYERAWKNLNAISGDQASESNAEEENLSPKAKRVFVPQSELTDPTPFVTSAPAEAKSGNQSMFVAPSETPSQKAANAPVKPVGGKEIAPAGATPASDAKDPAPAADVVPASAQSGNLMLTTDNAKKDGSKSDHKSDGKKDFFSNFSGLFTAPSAKATASQYPGMKAPKSATSVDNSSSDPSPMSPALPPAVETPPAAMMLPSPVVTPAGPVMPPLSVTPSDAQPFSPPSQ